MKNQVLSHLYFSFRHTIICWFIFDNISLSCCDALTYMRYCQIKQQTIMHIKKRDKTSRYYQIKQQIIMHIKEKKKCLIEYIIFAD